MVNEPLSKQDSDLVKLEKAKRIVRIAFDGEVQEVMLELLDKLDLTGNNTWIEWDTGGNGPMAWPVGHVRKGTDGHLIISAYNNEADREEAIRERMIRGSSSDG